MISTRRGWSVAALATLIFSALLASCGSTHLAKANPSHVVAASPAVQHTSYVGADCPSNLGSVSPSQGIVQKMNGAVTACLRVGALKPGKYYISIQGVELAKGSAAARKGLPVPSGSQAGPKVNLSLSPSTGSPGSVIHFTGTISSPLSKRPGHIGICWSGCESGLQYSGVPVSWTSPTRFSGSFAAPAAPWFESGTSKIASLRTGDYRVSVECLTLVKGCGLGGGEGSASYQLEVPRGAASWCPDTAGCARLETSDSSVFPGEVVKIKGYVPLVSIIGSSQPFQFQTQVSPEPSPPNEISFSTTGKGGSVVSMGRVRITIGVSPSFASLGKVVPAGAISAGAWPISENPANPGEIVWCSGGTIALVSQNGSHAISTASVARELRSKGLGLIGGSVPSCNSVALADGGISGKMVLASFLAAPNSQAPPFTNVALETSDDGASWTFLPVPSGASLTTFAGFRYFGSSVQAMFAPGLPNFPTVGSAGLTPLVETLKGGSSSWTSGSLQCPNQGPCVTFGSYLPGNCAMNGSMQSVFYSIDGGKNWTQPRWPAQIQSCWSTELVPISTTNELLISTSSPYLIRESVDGGAVWKVVGTPAVPGTGQGGSGLIGADVQMLSTGSLLVSGQRNSDNNWQLLSPGSKKWCKVSGLPSGALNSSRFSRLYPLGNTLYWISAVPGSTAGTPVLHSIPESQVKC